VSKAATLRRPDDGDPQLRVANEHLPRLRADDEVGEDTAAGAHADQPRHADGRPHRPVSDRDTLAAPPRIREAPEPPLVQRDRDVDVTGEGIHAHERVSAVEHHEPDLARADRERDGRGGEPDRRGRRLRPVVDAREGAIGRVRDP
jgi:hypothetical protein